MNKVRVRFGIRMPFFPNMATFVFYVSPETWDSMQGVVSTLRGLIAGAGYPDVASKIVCEAS